MIYHEPIPLYEAHQFLCNLADDFPDRAVMQRQLRKNEEIKAEFSQCYNTVMEISEILNNSIKVSRADVDALYSPLRDKTGDGSDALVTHTIADCFFMYEIQRFMNYDENSAYDLILKNADKMPASLYRMLFSEKNDWNEEANLKISELIQLIINSNYSDQAKLTLIDAATNPMKYAEKLIALLKPVVKAFRECEHLYRPLLKMYEDIFNEIPTENGVVQYFWHSSFAGVHQFDLYPMIMRPISCTFDQNYPHDGSGLSFIGFMVYQFTNLLNHREVESELIGFMDALANLNRIKIIKELAKGKKFGREISDEMHLTTGRISQNLNQLVETGLVKVEDVGAKVYCAIDHTGTQKLMRLLEELFTTQE